MEFIGIGLAMGLAALGIGLGQGYWIEQGAGRYFKTT